MKFATFLRETKFMTLKTFCFLKMHLNNLLIVIYLLIHTSSSHFILMKSEKFLIMRRAHEEIVYN